MGRADRQLWPHLVSLVMTKLTFLHMMIHGGVPMTAQEVAERLGKSRITVYRLIRSGAFTSTRIGGTWDVDPTSVSTYLRANTITQGSPA